MTWVAAAIAATGVLGAGVSAYSAHQNQNAANNAARNGAAAADPAASYRPYYMAYLEDKWPSLASTNYTDILNDPSFKFVHDQGMRDITGGASAMGTLRSGSLIEDSSKFNTGLADSFINSQFQRNMALMGQLGNFSGLNIGNPGVAGQITANAGMNNFGMGNNVMGQIGSGISMAQRLWGGPSGSSSGSVNVPGIGENTATATWGP